MPAGSGPAPTPFPANAADGTRRTPSRRTAIVLAALGAVAFLLSFPLGRDATWGWPFVFAWPALLAAAAARSGGWRGIAACVAPPFFLAILWHEWWMHEVTVLGMPVLVVYLTAWTVVLAWLLARLGGGGGARLPWIASIPIALVAVEFLRGDLVCTGYAWFFAAHPLVEWREVAQVASLGGGWALSALAGVVAGGLLDAFVGSGPRRIVSPAVAVALLAASLLFGRARIAPFDELAARPSEPGQPAAVLVQTNVPMSNKLAWSPEDQVEDFLGGARLTIDGAKRARNDGYAVAVAVWPETMVPGFGLEPESIQTLVGGGYYPGDRFAQAVTDLSRAIDAPLLAGSPAYEGLRVEGNRFVWDRQFNSAYLVDGRDGGPPTSRTDKIYLTPFGETMPIISRSDWLEAQLLALGAAGMTFDLEAADAPRPIRIGTGDAAFDAGVPICFEITMPWASRRIAFADGKRVADVLFNLSNDGWFGPSELGRRQHLQVACLRAIELDTAVLRSVNTGYSAWIDRTGRIRRVLGANEPGSIVVRLEPSEGVPLAARVGDGVAWCALVLAVVSLLLRRSGDRIADGSSVRAA
ncbi:MAG: apolipoprotein N-acyltransferase [Planctomycetaceae bacterium]|nr:apolipoprotein N-acyltransferase [Planctomycetaceae bacterium]